MNVNDIKLYPHNQETYNKIQERWKTTNKVATVQATGTGKSYLILKCLYNITNENKIVLAPSNYILEQLESEVGEKIPNTVLMTYSKLSYMTQEEINELNPSLIVLDEFHRCGAEQWGNGIQKLINTFSNAKILGTSATHIRFLDNERDMADELFDNNIVNNLSLTEAIVREILPMPKYVSALYTFSNELDNLRNKVDNSKNYEGSKEELYKEIDKLKNKLEKSKGIPQIFKKHLTDNNNDKFIVFCKDKNHLDEMKIVVADWFKKAKVSKNIDSYIVYSGDSEADKQVELFKNNNKENTIKLLFSIDMFNEGIHIKDVSGVILLRPTVSPIIYYQQVGRAIQVGKESNPLIFDFVNNFDSIGAKNFIGELRDRIELEDDNKNSINNKKLSDILEFMVIDETLETKELFANIENKLIDNWDDKYNELTKYKNDNGDCNISQSNKQLIYWISYQRELYKFNKLSEDRVKKLEDLEFAWDALNEKWDMNYKSLINYKEKKGDCNVPNNIDNGVLARWVRTQRSNYIRGELSEYRIDKLEEIGFSWTPLDERWNKKYKELKQYIEKFKAIDYVFMKKINKSLYKWLSKNKVLYNKKQLSKERIEFLNILGVEFKNNNTSGIVGVSWNKSRNSWKAKIMINKKEISLGDRKSKLEAIKLRRDAEIKYFGKSDINLDDFKEECE